MHGMDNIKFKKLFLYAVGCQSWNRSVMRCTTSLVGVNNLVPKKSVMHGCIMS